MSRNASKTTPERKAQAVAQAQMADNRSTARTFGVAEGTIRRWRAEVDRRGTAREKDLAKRTEEIAEAIQRQQREAREELMAGIRAVIPMAVRRGSLQALATAYGILTDKDLKFAEAEAKARSQGSSAGLPDDQDKEAIVARIERLRAARSGRN